MNLTSSQSQPKHSGWWYCPLKEVWEQKSLWGSNFVMTKRRWPFCLTTSFDKGAGQRGARLGSQATWWVLPLKWSWMERSGFGGHTVQVLYKSRGDHHRGRWNVASNPPIDGFRRRHLYRPRNCRWWYNVLVADDQSGARMRLISTAEQNDNRSTWVCLGAPHLTSSSRTISWWRNAGARPSFSTAWAKRATILTREIYYDQKDENGNWIFGSYTACPGADDTYVYMMSERGDVCKSSSTNKKRLMGQNIPTGQYSHMTFNAKDRMMYLSLEIWPYYGLTLYTLHLVKAPHGLHGTIWRDYRQGLSLPCRRGHGREVVGTLCGLGSDHEGNVYICDQKFHCAEGDPLLSCTVFAI